MFKNIKKQAAVGLVLASIGGLCPLQAMENNQGQDFERDLARAIANNLLETNNTQQVMEIDQVDDSELAQAIALSLANDSNSMIIEEKTHSNTESIINYSTSCQEVGPFYSVNNVTIPNEIKARLLCDIFFEQSISNGNPMNLFLVCKDWKNTIQNNFKSIENAWKTHYGVSDSDYQLMKTMKVQYRPNPESDKDMVTLSIPTFANPFGYKFNLSMCGDAGKYLCITTGYRYGVNPENKDKVEIFVAPRNMIGKDLATTAAHYAEIFPKWSDKNLVGIFFTWGNWVNNNWYDYVTNLTHDQISTKNCLRVAATLSTPIRSIHSCITFITCIPSSFAKFLFHFEPK